MPDAGWKTEVATSITALASQLAGVVADSGAVATLSSLFIPQWDTTQKYRIAILEPWQTTDYYCNSYFLTHTLNVAVVTDGLTVIALVEAGRAKIRTNYCHQ